MIAARLRAARDARRARWEGLCHRCGLCCFEKEQRDGAWITDRTRPCPYLDLRTKLCTVYARRFTTCARCRPMTLRHALFTRWLPSECGYVRHYRKGQSPEVREDVGSVA